MPVWLRHLLPLSAVSLPCVDVSFPRDGSPGVLAYGAANDSSLGLSARFPCATGTSIPAVLCRTADTRLGSVIVISEWFGVSEATLAVAHTLNAAGMDSYVLNVHRDHHLC